MRILFRKILLAVNILFAGMLALSYLAVHISPVEFILPALFGLMYPYLLIINIMLAALWAVNLKLEALISVAVILAGLNHLKDFVRPSGNSKAAEPIFTLMSYNVRLFSMFEAPASMDIEKEILGLISEEKPDILCIQEYYSAKGWEDINSRISAAMGRNVDLHVKMSGMGKSGYYGIATFSVFPIINRGEIIHPNSSSLTIYSDLVVGNDTIRVFNNHLQSYRLHSMERSFINEILGKQEMRYSRIRNLFESLREGFVKRASQANVLRSFTEHSQYPIIVTGDFNDTPVSYSYRKIRKGLTDSFIESGHGAGFTYKGNYPTNRIDFILHDNHLKSVSFNIIRKKYSDHYPVIGGFVWTN